MNSKEFRTELAKSQLTVRANGDANSYALLDERGQWLLAVLHNGQALEAKQLATLNRLAACWNACVGIPTDLLKDHPAPFSELREERDALLAQVAALPSLDQVHAIVASHLTSVYLCTRVWSAWSVGTMSEDDFVEATETEFADELAAAIFASFGTAPTVPAIPAEAAAVGAVLDPDSLEQGDPA